MGEGVATFAAMRLALRCASSNNTLRSPDGRVPSGFCLPGGISAVDRADAPLAVPGIALTDMGAHVVVCCYANSLVGFDPDRSHHRRVRDRPPLGRSDRWIR